MPIPLVGILIYLDIINNIKINTAHIITTKHIKGLSRKCKHNSKNCHFLIVTTYYNC